MAEKWIAGIALGAWLAAAGLAAQAPDAGTAQPAQKQAARETARQPGAAPLALPFIKDDYPRALSQASARKLPLFVDAWAPW